MPRLVLKFRRWQKGLKEFVADHPIDLLPARRGWAGYSRWDAVADVKAGVNVALLALPQGMAFALLAGVDLSTGIACAAVAAVAAAFFCSSHHISLGPTNATAFTVFSFFATYPALEARQAELMPLLALLIALILLVGAFLHIAEAVQYISRSVMVGYITGAAVLIIANQVPGILGIDLRGADGMRPRTFFGTVERLFESLSQTQWTAVSVAVITLVVLVVLLRWRPGWPGFAISLVIASMAAWGLGFRYPAFQDLSFLSAFHWSDLQPKVPSWTPTIIEDIGAIFGLALAIAFIAALETSLMVKGMAGRSGSNVNLDQDFFGVGMANAASALVGGMPASSSLTRSVLAFSAGGRSRFAMFINGVTCALVAVLLGASFTHIPRAVIAALVIAVAWRLFNRQQIRVCLTATRSDALTMVGTFLATLILPLYIAIFAGVALSIALYLRKAARPELVEYEFSEEGSLRKAEKRRIPAISIVHVEGDLFFGAAELFRTQVQRTMRDPNLKVIILRLRNARNLDATSVMALETLIDTVRAEGRNLLISGVTKSLYRVLRDAGLLEILDRRNVFINSPTNPNVSTRNALRRAQELLGTEEAEIQIYVDQKKKKSR